MSSASTPPLLGIVQLGTKHLAAKTSCLNNHSRSASSSSRSGGSLSSPVMKLAREVDSWTHKDWSRTFIDLERQQLSSSRFTKLTSKIGADIENMNLNRYPNVLPYDHSRVNITSETSGEEIYINANHVRVTDANRHYILTQGPLNSTIDEFWLMAFQHNTSAIVMLCRCEEPNGINNLMQKSGKYWPDKVGDTLILGEVTGGLEVTLKESSLEREVMTEPGEVNKLAGQRFDFIKRTLLLTSKETGEKRTVKHFHYVTWPDFDVPSSPDLLIDFLMDIRSSGSLGTPPIIHCSAGIGRSGTLALVDSCLVLAELGTELSLSIVLETLMNMRTMRAGCIQTESQLRFSVEAILLGLERLGLNKVHSHKRVSETAGEHEVETKKRKNSQS